MLSRTIQASTPGEGTWEERRKMNQIFCSRVKSFLNWLVDIIMLLDQLSYVIKTQLKHPKLPTRDFGCLSCVFMASGGFHVRKESVIGSFITPAS